MGILKSIKPAFWLANGMEACERLAYFGIRAVLPLMMVAVGTGGLGLSMSDKGIILGVWALIQCIVPMVSGGFSESFGYKKSLIVAFIVNICGYLLMANITNLSFLMLGSSEVEVTRGMNFVLMMIAGCTIGVGTAIFKPPVGGVVAQSLDESNSGLGFGIFYWVVNIGGFLAPMAASALRGTDEAPTWSYVFYGAAFVTLFNLIITLLFFREPAHANKTEQSFEKVRIEDDSENHLPQPDEESSQSASDTLLENTHEGNDAHGVLEEFAKDAAEDVSDATPKEQKESPKDKKAWSVLVETLAILWHDKKTLWFLLIVSGFWLMFMQLWDLLPNFIEEWVDRRNIGNWLSQFSIFESFLESDKSLKPEMIINIDSAAIICFVLPLSALFARFRMMTALVLGMIISVIGFVMSGMVTTGELACLAVFIFAIGEIICSPKFDEYIGMTAPEDKKAIYMGFVNIPFAIGWACGNFLSGPLYEIFSSKKELAKRYLMDNGVDSSSLESLKIEDLMQKVQQMTNSADSYEASRVLWDAYAPWLVWIILGAIGFVSMVGMIIFYYKSGMSVKDLAAATKAAEEQDESDQAKEQSDQTKEQSESLS